MFKSKIKFLKKRPGERYASALAHMNLSNKVNNNKLYKYCICRFWITHSKIVLIITFTIWCVLRFYFLSPKIKMPKLWMKEMYFFQQTDVIFTDLVYIRVCHKSVCHHKLYYFRRRIIAQPWIILILVRDFFRDFFRAQFCMAKSHEENSNICMILYYWKGIIIRKMFRFMNNALVFGSLAVAASLLWWPPMVSCWSMYSIGGESEPSFG